MEILSRLHRDHLYVRLSVYAWKRPRVAFASLLLVISLSFGRRNAYYVV